MEIKQESKSLEDQPKWRDLTILGYPNYRVYSDGKIENVKLKKFISGSIDVKGYRKVILSGDKDKVMSIHRLVAMMFIPNPENKPTVDHINGDKLDNRVENLAWASYTEQNIKRRSYNMQYGPIAAFTLNGEWIKVWLVAASAAEECKLTESDIIDACKSDKILSGCFWRRCDRMVIPGEEWKLSPFPEYSQIYVSTLGRVCGRKGTMTFGHYSGSYMNVNVTDEKGHPRMIAVHRLIAATFLPNGRDDAAIVNHLNSIRTDNRPCNLEYTTRKGNMEHAAQNGRMHGGKNHRPVVRINPDGTSPMRYSSVKEAAESVFGSMGNISSACHGKLTAAYGYRWIFADAYDAQSNNKSV